MFRAMFSPIIRSIWLYLQYLVEFNQDAAGWCLGYVLTLNEVFLNLTEVFPCFFLSCMANTRIKLAKTGHGPHSSTLVVVCVVRLLFVLFYVLCVNVYCHRVTTQLQLINIYQIISCIIYHIIYHNISCIIYHIYHISYCKYSQVLLMMSENIARNM